MKELHDQELSALFAHDRGGEALVDEAFVQRCVARFRRTQRQLLVLKLIVIFATAGSVGLMMPLLADLVANASASLAAAWAVLDRNAMVSDRIMTAFSAFGGAVGGMDRAMAVGIVVALVVRQYGSRLFRLGES